MPKNQKKLCKKNVAILLQKQNEFFPGIKEFVKQQKLKNLTRKSFQQHLKNKGVTKNAKQALGLL